MQFTRDTIQDPGFDIGEWTYGNPKIVSFAPGEKLKIGKFCSISDGVLLMFGGDHDMRRVTTYPLDFFFPGGNGSLSHIKLRGDLTIGNDVWIGDGALIFAGVTIEDGAVIAARSVVTKDVRPYEVVGGVPAHHIKFRFDYNTIRALQKIAWWNWPIEKIQEAMPLMISGDIKGFVEAYK